MTYQEKVISFSNFCIKTLPYVLNSQAHYTLQRTCSILSASWIKFFFGYNIPHCCLSGLITADKPDVCIHTQFNSINTYFLCSSEIALQNTLDKAWNLFGYFHIFLLSPSQLLVVPAEL